MVQNVRDECCEFNQQYNHVIGCWKRYRGDLNQSFNQKLCFHEARSYLQEIQQQFGTVMQEDYGAGLRIQEL